MLDDAKDRESSQQHPPRGMSYLVPWSRLVAGSTLCLLVATACGPSDHPLVAELAAELAVGVRPAQVGPAGGDHSVFAAHPLVGLGVVLALLATCLLTGGYVWQCRRVSRFRRLHEHIADDLHDDLGSRLATVMLRLDLLRRDAVEPSVREGLEEALVGVRALSEDLRDTAWTFHAEEETLGAFADRMQLFAHRLLVGQAYTFVVPETFPAFTLPADERRQLFLLFKEALHNAARHARASRVVIRLRLAGGTLHLQVEDDGCGFDPEVRHAGRGLRSMRSRAARIGAQLVIDSAPGRGTRVNVRLPVGREEVVWALRAPARIIGRRLRRALA